MNATSINPKGYSIEFCIDCEIKPTGLPEINFKIDELKIEANPLDCSKSLKLNKNFKNPDDILY